jgi:hypothetical protein
MAGIMLPSVRATSIIWRSAAWTRASSRPALRVASSLFCTTSTSWETRMISSSLATVVVCALTPTIFFSPFSRACW